MSSSQYDFLSNWDEKSFQLITTKYFEHRDFEKFSGSEKSFYNKSTKLHSKLLNALIDKFSSFIDQNTLQTYNIIYEFYFDELLNYYAENIQTATEDVILDFIFYRGLRKIPLYLSDKKEILPAFKLLYKILFKNNIVNEFLADFVSYCSSFTDFYKSHSLNSGGQSFFWNVDPDWTDSYYSFLDKNYLLFDTNPPNIGSRDYVGILENDLIRKLDKMVFIARRDWYQSYNITNRELQLLKQKDKDLFLWKMKFFITKWYTSPLDCLGGLSPEQAILLERKFFDEKSFSDSD